MLFAGGVAWISVSLYCSMPYINVLPHLQRRGLRRNIFQPIVEEGIALGPEDAELQPLEQPGQGIHWLGNRRHPMPSLKNAF